MKNIIKFSSIIAFPAILLSYSCFDEILDPIGCGVQLISINLYVTKDYSENRTINLTIGHDSEVMSIDSVRWVYGDAKYETLVGTKARHTYLSAGTYKVEAKFTARSEDNSCVYELVDNAVIN